LALDVVDEIHNQPLHGGELFRVNLVPSALEDPEPGVR
jgi:hypothetical protein